MERSGTSPKQSGLRNFLIAVVVIAVVGVATFYGVSYISSVQPPVSTLSSGTTGSSASTVSVSSPSTLQTGSTSSPSTESSQSYVPQNEFTLVGKPGLVSIGGSMYNITVTYLNTGTESLSVNLFIAVYLPNGTEWSNGVIYANAPTVAAGQNFTSTAQTPQFYSSGKYSATFYVVDEGTLSQISANTTVTFEITS